MKNCVFGCLFVSCLFVCLFVFVCLLVFCVFCLFACLFLFVGCLFVGISKLLGAVAWNPVGLTPEGSAS